MRFVLLIICIGVGCALVAPSFAESIAIASAAAAVVGVALFAASARPGDWDGHPDEMRERMEVRRGGW